MVAVIQVKTTLTKEQLKKAMKNINSIDKLNAKIGGKIISANGQEIIEKRRIKPYKIIVSKTSDIDKGYDFSEELKSADIIYIVDKNYKLFVKNKNVKGVVNTDLDELSDYQTKESTIESYVDEKLLIFSLILLDKLKLINNSIIINYQEYLKGGVNDGS